MQSRVVAASLFFSLVLTGAAAAQTAEELRNRINRGTVGIMSGSITGTYARVASDLAAVLDDPGGLRVVVSLGKGSVQNINDLLYLRGIDLAIVQSDLLNYMKRERVHANIQKRIHYVTKLYNEEFHLIAATRVKDFRELANQPVILGTVGSGSHMTASIVFEALGVPVKPVAAKDHDTALEMVKDGRALAWVRVTGKPNSSLARLKREEGVHFLEVPPNPKLLETYLPSALTAQEYPNIIEEGQKVRTIAVGAVMAVYGWQPKTERYKKVERFVETFFSRYEDFLKPPRHKKWQEVNLGTTVPGWTRFKPAADWLAKLAVAQRNSATPAAITRTANASDDLRAIIDGLTQEDREAIRDFLMEYLERRRSLQ